MHAKCEAAGATHAAGMVCTRVSFVCRWRVGRRIGGGAEGNLASSTV